MIRGAWSLRSAWLLVALAGLCCGTRTDGAVDFERRVAPVLLKRCVECHAGSEPAGKLDLSSSDGLRAGGESGSVVVPGQPDQSYLFQRIRDGEMPPKKGDQPQPLPAEEIEPLREWIEAGAAWPEGRRLDPYEITTERRAGRDWWSLQPIERPTPPQVRSAHGLVNPVDRFVLARLDEHGWTPAPAADRRTLIRCVYADLWGLPPSFEEIEPFATDDAPDAYERLVDRLLASPRFGERWARYWLDVVRFAETCGYERDQVKPHAWRYRDWVIQALVEDKPYDRFIHEQVAGDELPDRSEATVIATGMLRLGTWNDEPNDPEEYKYERLEDMIHATSTAFLAMTVKCARCHDHKYDPIRQTDYFRMANGMWAGFIEPGSGKLQGGPDKDQLGYDVLGWTDRARDVPPLRLLKKGDIHLPGDVVPAGHLSMIPALDRPLEPPTPDSRTSQLRLQLARWLTDPANPLTARVWVNRLWQHHFGHGLVRSPDNFGFNGERPTHPELLDWLAAELIDRDWRSKDVHRLLLLSNVYRQSSVHPQHEAYAQEDFGNRLWWRAERRRLDAEALRDRLLVASGQLELARFGGPSFSPEISADALEGLSMKERAWQASPPSEQGRRSIYIFTKRSLLPPLMTAFDAPDTTLPCGQRDVTTVAPQALALLNNAFIHEQSQALARRVVALTGDRSQQVEQAWRLALGRSPSRRELAAGLQHLDAQVRNLRGLGEEAENVETDELPVADRLVLHLRADRGVETDGDGRVCFWPDLAPNQRHAARQDGPAARPLLVTGAMHGQPVVRFDGQARFLALDQQVLNSSEFSICAVVTDLASGGHREIFSNWDGAAGNATSSVFLGTTGAGVVRFSDDFANAGTVRDPSEPFLLIGVNSATGAAVFQNDVLLAEKNSPLHARRLTTPYVLGQQGNINGEFWQGDIAEIAVYDRDLDDAERRRLTRYFMRRYGLRPLEALVDPELLALASLCQVLLNTNEFMYID